MTTPRSRFAAGLPPHGLPALWIANLFLALTLGARLLAPVQTQAQAAYGGLYTGLIYSSQSGAVNSPERSIGAVLLSIDSAGNIAQAGGGLSGRVNASGAITWDTPNPLYITTGTITAGRISSTGTLVSGNGALTTTFRLDAKTSATVIAPNADPVLDSLSWVNPAPFGGTLQHVIFQNNQFVAVGGGGLVATSPDGRDWLPQRTPSKRTLNGVAFGNGVHVAVGDGETILTSPDAITWTLRATTNFVKFDLTAVAFGNGRFLAVGRTGNSLYSTDGINWTARPGGGSVCVDVVFAGGRFVITSNGVGGTLVNTSADGITWNAGAGLPVPSIAPSRGIAYGGGKYLVTTSVGNDGKTKVFQSPDGAAWTLIPNILFNGASSGLTLRGIIHDGSVFLAFDAFNGLSYNSTDGANWRLGKGANREVKTIGIGGGRYVAVGDTIATSTNGIGWDDQVTRRHLPHINFVGGDISKKVFVGQGGYYDKFGLNVSGLGVTNDLRTGMALTPSVADYFAGDGGFVRVNGQDYTVEGRPTIYGSLFSSPLPWFFGANGGLFQPKTATILTNGNFRDVITNFTRINTGTTADLLAGGNWGMGTFLVGRGGTILRASDFRWTNWTRVNSGVTVDLRSAAKSEYSKALAVVVGDQGTILTSPDGVTWTKKPSGTTENLVAVAYHEFNVLSVSNRLYIAMGENGTAVLSYDNGTNWVPSANSFGRKVRSLAYLGNGNAPAFTAVGEYGFTASTSDGTNWVQGKMDADLTGAVYGNGRWVVTGPFYSLISRDGIRWDLHSFKDNGGSLAYGGGQFAVLNGNGTTILTSPDAINWVESYVAPANVLASLNTLAYGAGRWVAVGFSGLILTSTDTLTWTTATINAAHRYTAVRYANGLWVAVGENNTGAYSVNGVNWTAIEPRDYKRGVAYGNGVWVSVGDSGRVSSSTNGIAWTARNQDNAYALKAVEYFGGRFVAIGAGGGTNLALVSTNGVNWTSTGLPFQSAPRALAAANGTLLIVGEKGMIVQGAYPAVGLPAVSVSPSSNFNANAGSTLALRATASGAAPLQFLWSRNGIALRDGLRVRGATTESLSVTLDREEDGGEYSVEVINDVGSRVSFPVTVTVAAPPSFQQEPASQVATAGGKLTLSAGASGPATTYQWFKDGVKIEGATNRVLTLAGVQPADAGSYTVTASNGFGARASQTASVSVSAPPGFAVEPAIPASRLNFITPGFYNQVQAIAPLPGGKTLIGGAFKITAGNLNFTNLARLNADGTPDTTWPNPALNSVAGQAVSTMVALPDGRVLVGGLFTFANPAAGGHRDGLALLGADGRFDPAFAPGFNLSVGAVRVNALTRQDDGKILLAGAFYLANQYFVGRLNPDLTVDTTFATMTSKPLQTEGYSVIGQADGRVVAGSASGGLVRALTNGIRDQSFQAPVAGLVIRSAMLPDDRIALVGNFNASQRVNFAVLTPSGAVDPTIQADLNGSGRALAVLPDGSVVVGGGFTAVNSTHLTSLALVRKDGSVDPSFKFDFGANGLIYVINVTADGSLLVGGNFTRVNGIEATNLVRIGSRPAGVTLAITAQPRSANVDAGDTATFSVASRGGAPLTFQWRKDGVVMAGATQSSLRLANVATNDVANYTVEVTDPSGSVVSQAASLTVQGVAPVQVETGGFESWATANNLPAGARGPSDDPDDDGAPNIFEYYFGTNPASAASAAEPQGDSVRAGNDTFPALTFVRSKTATRISAQVLVSSSVTFGDTLGTAAEVVTDLGNGTERVTVRSATSDRVQAIQFLKLRLGLAP